MDEKSFEMPLTTVVLNYLIFFSKFLTKLNVSNFSMSQKHFAVYCTRNVSVSIVFSSPSPQPNKRLVLELNSSGSLRTFEQVCAIRLDLENFRTFTDIVTYSITTGRVITNSVPPIALGGGQRGV